MTEEGRIVIIPRYLVFVRFMHLPSMDDAEIASMVRLQAVKEVPCPREELIIGYKSLGSYKEGFSYVILAMVKKEIIEKMLSDKTDRIKQIRLFTEILYLFLLKKNILDTDKVELVLHIGRDYSEIMISDKAMPIFSRGIKNTEHFFDELRHSILAYQKDRNNPSVDKVIVLYSKELDIGELKPRLIEYFHIPVDFHGYSEDLAALDLPLDINLIPKEITDKRTKLEKKRDYLVTYSLVGIAIVLAFSFMAFKIYEKREMIRVLSERLDKIQNKTDRLGQLQDKIDIAKGHIKKGAYITDLISDSYALIPLDITLSGISYDGKKLFFYQGTCRDTSSVFNFVKKLEGLGCFEKVEVKYATKKKVKSEEYTDFNIQCNLAL